MFQGHLLSVSSTTAVCFLFGVIASVYQYNSIGDPYGHLYQFKARLLQSYANTTKAEYLVNRRGKENFEK
ncbi:hypothetical protein J1N35_030123 [Gossypium stocksii]|uniref:Uncharacterized protein n=1 Tax=Gossypium stocksii TaxID=47602 RepID=A0A9D3ZSM6_9ROSI|nr:hypothetical protein J1N35_030123 [Gossypium stocksii]